MAEPRAQYACDTCCSRKVGCSRDRPSCERCKAEGSTCVYSRLGVIRRNRKQKENKRPRLSERDWEPPANPSGATDTSRRPPQLPPDNSGTTHERLQRLVGKDRRSLRLLASLLEECAGAWHDSSAFDRLSEGAAAEFAVFNEGQLRIWVDALVSTLQKESLPLAFAPPDVLEHLASSRPQQVSDRAWLVMFYSVAMTVVSSTSPLDESTMAKLKSNLWLAFNDVRLLLEPSITSIQALIILACQVDEFMTPALSWTLVSKACIMLQALGIAYWRLDAQTRERRAMLFWRLNFLDNALALILARPPTFHREMMIEIPLPTLDQLLPSQPYFPTRDTPTLFNAHYRHQIHLLSRVMSDVWYCLHGQGTDDAEKVKESLESWYRQATEVLGAAALTEKPLLTPSAADSIDVGLETLRFHYYSLLVLVLVSNRQLRAQSTYPAQQMLKLLSSIDGTAPNSKEPYTCLLWQRLHSPLAAFGTLWSEIVIQGKPALEQGKQFLEAIEQLPAFLGKLKSRNPLVAKLESITERIVQQARLTLYSPDEPDQRVAAPGISAQEKQDTVPVHGETLGQGSTPSVPPLAPTPWTNVTDISGDESLDSQLDSLFNWPEDGFFDATFDWFA